MKKCKNLSDYALAKYVRRLVKRGTSTETIRKSHPEVSPGTIAALRAHASRQERASRRAHK